MDDLFWLAVFGAVLYAVAAFVSWRHDVYERRRRRVSRRPPRDDKYGWGPQ